MGDIENWQSSFNAENISGNSYAMDCAWDRLRSSEENTTRNFQPFLAYGQIALTSEASDDNCSDCSDSSCSQCSNCCCNNGRNSNCGYTRNRCNRSSNCNRCGRSCQNRNSCSW